MTRQEQVWLQRLGFATSVGGMLGGDRIWYKRIDTEMTVVRQRDGAEKRQDLANNPNLPIDDSAANRQWALALAVDYLTEWQAWNGE